MSTNTQASSTRARIITAVKFLLFAAAILLFFRLVRRIDWAQVGDALDQLNLADIGLLILLIGGRQLLSAVPMERLVPGLGMRRALRNDLAGFMIAVVAPSPSDTLLRLKMLTSWGVEASLGVACVLLNSVFYFVARFSAPIFGLVIYTVAYGEHVGGYVAAAISGSLVLAGLLAGLLVITKGEALAHSLGSHAAKTLSRSRVAKAEPEAWGGALATFQRAASGRLIAAFPLAVTSMIAFVFVDATILLVGLRAVGVSSGELSVLAIYAAFLCVYPLTALPLMGFGILDAGLIALLAEHDPEDTTHLVAAVVLWRIATLLVPVLLGIPALFTWRGRSDLASDDVAGDDVASEEAAAG